MIVSFGCLTSSSQKQFCWRENSARLHDSRSRLTTLTTASYRTPLRRQGCYCIECIDGRTTLREPRHEAQLTYWRRLTWHQRASADSNSAQRRRQIVMHQRSSGVSSGKLASTTTMDPVPDPVRQKIQKIPTSSFYGEWHGHRTEHLNILLPRLREKSEALIWTAGDSSLDNKYWFSTRRPAVPGVYSDLLQPPTSVADVTYWLNHLSAQRKSGTRYSAINTAVEATTLNERCFKLRPQDRFIRDHLQPDDVLIVSIGGNDIAMAPSPCTIASVAGLLCLPQSCLESGRSFGAVPFNDCCCGCGASLASCGCSCPPCLGYCESSTGTNGRPSKH